MKQRTMFIAILLLWILITIVFICTGCIKVTSTPQITTGDNSTPFQHTNGLSLSLSTDSTTYKTHQQISIVVDEKNILSTLNTVSTSNAWLYHHFHVATCDFSSPFGIAVFHGDYTGSNFTTATPLILYDPNIMQLCTTIYPIDAYSFQPSSDMASLIQGNDPHPNGYSQQMYYQITLNGYWPDRSGSKLTSFEPGIYTVAAGDEWGGLIVVHFTVTE